MIIWHQVWSLAFLVGVLGNLAAAVLWAFPALIHLHRKIDRHHAEHMAALGNGSTNGDGEQPDTAHRQLQARGRG